MGMSEFDPAARERRAWNAGRRVGAKRPLKPRQVWAVRFYLDQHQRLRDRALFDLAIDSKLRGCDIVKIKIGEITSGGHVRTRAIVVQQKTGRPVQFELMDYARTSLLAWLERRSGTLADYAFPAASTTPHISARDNTRAWLTSGSPGSACGGRSTAPLALSDKGVDHLQGDGQPTCCPDPARSHEDREHRSVPRRRYP